MEGTGKKSIVKLIMLAIAVVVVVVALVFGVQYHQQTVIREDQARKQELATSEAAYETARQQTVAPNSIDSPVMKEQQWLSDNLPPEDFNKAGAETLDGRVVAATSEHYVLEVNAADEQIWNLTTTEIADTTEDVPAVVES